MPHYACSLEKALQEVSLHELKSPTLVIIGKVVALAPGWLLAASTGHSLQDGRDYDPSLLSNLVSKARQLSSV